MTLPYSNLTTSKAAAISMEDYAVGLRGDVLRYIQEKAWGGATCDEVEEAFDATHQTISPRINELKSKGLLKDSGIRRKTRSNRKAIVWWCVPLYELKTPASVQFHFHNIAAISVQE